MNTNIQYFPLEEEEIAYSYEDMDDGNEEEIPANSYNESLSRFTVNWEDLT